MSALHSFVELLKGKFMLLLPFVKLVHVNFHLSSCIWLFRFVYTDTDNDITKDAKHFLLFLLLLLVETIGYLYC